MSHLPSRPQHTDGQPARRLQHFLEHPAAGGVVLMLAAALALLTANSPWAAHYLAVLDYSLAGLSVLHWINDGLMAVFFLLVGREIKREMVNGQLSVWNRRILPGIAALGGMVGPAMIYLALNQGPHGQPAGWAIPAATDIAFALGVLSLLGPRVPISLKVFLTALAILDDLGAILIIAFFYTGQLHMDALIAAAAVLAWLVAMNRLGCRRLTWYLLAGVVLWACILKSGIHATLAGVLLALTIPHATAVDPVRADTTSPLLRLEHAIAPWVGFVIVPIFGFANAGVNFAGMSLQTLLSPVPLGIMLGLFVGKQVGIYCAAALAIRLGWAALPANASWRQLYGVALLCGIGFTMSLFIGLLAFPHDPALQNGVKLGVLLGSLLSALVGVVLLRSVPVRAQPCRER